MLGLMRNQAVLAVGVVEQLAAAMAQTVALPSLGLEVEVEVVNLVAVHLLEMGVLGVCTSLVVVEQRVTLVLTEILEGLVVVQVVVAVSILLMRKVVMEEFQVGAVEVVLPQGMQTGVTVEEVK